MMLGLRIRLWRLKHKVITWCYYQYAKLTNRTIVHLIHIGKTGGTAIKNSLGINRRPYVNEQHVVFAHSHGTTLRHIPVGEKAFFIVRDPISRFVSGFYSRKQKGVHGTNEWSSAERTAFTAFATPNELAEALVSTDEVARSSAEAAMQAIGHVNQSCWHWFDDEAYLLSRVNDIIFVGKQETLTRDFNTLRERLAIPERYQLPSDTKGAHKSAPENDTSLSEVATNSLREWYSPDYAFLALLEKEKLLSHD